MIARSVITSRTSITPTPTNKGRMIQQLGTRRGDRSPDRCLLRATPRADADRRRRWRAPRGVLWGGATPDCVMWR
jgi:hypothetical protein